jgi:hypothetical protein
MMQTGKTAARDPQTRNDPMGPKSGAPHGQRPRHDQTDPEERCWHIEVAINDEARGDSESHGNQRRFPDEKPDGRRMPNRRFQHDRLPWRLGGDLGQTVAQFVSVIP